MNWLIAPVFASTGRVVTQSPSSVFPLSIFLFADRHRGLHLRVTSNRRSYARATRHPEALIQQALFQRRQEEQHKGLLAAVAHETDAPNFALDRPESAGDFDVEFVEQLIPHFPIVNHAGNHTRLA